MRILLAAPIHHYSEFLKQKNGQFLKGQGQQSWLDALSELKHDVTVFRYTDPVFLPIKSMLYYEKIEKNFPLLIQKIKKIEDLFFYIYPVNYFKNIKLLYLSLTKKPDVIILSGGFTFLFPITLRAIKYFSTCRVMLFSGVNPIIASTTSEKSNIKNATIDLIVENDLYYANLWKKIGAKRVIVLPISAVDPRIQKIVKITHRDKQKYSCDICFVGSITKDRIPYFLKLTNFHFKFWGDIKPDVQLSEALRPFYQGSARGEEMVKIFNISKICLNLQPKDMKNGGNMRIFEIPGSGGFQLADKVPSEYFLEGEEVVLFSSPRDLDKKIRYYLKHNQERRKIAERGFLRAHRDHTYVQRFKKLLQED